MSNYYQNVWKHEKEHEEETRQPIVNDTTSVSSNSPGISIIIIIIDTSQHTNHEADEWIDYIYRKQSAKDMEIAETLGETREQVGENGIMALILYYCTRQGLIEMMMPYDSRMITLIGGETEEMEAEKQRLDLFAMAFEKKQYNKGKMKLYTDYINVKYDMPYILRNEQDKDIIK
ncbi:hypothetical protein BDF22DRAFT_653490 [Syncephalis plumigaleata]|nr:hypothetical protein BDF22DRAFT_653490 [Syncephalis plumigaleata]